MKSYYLCLMAIVTLLSFSSCSEENSTENDVRKEVKVTATFNGLSASGGVTTRAVDDGWEDGDAIGLFMKKAGTTLSQPALANNVKYTTGGDGTFTSLNKVYFPYKKEYVDFISYYPYTNMLNGLIYEVDVSDQSNLASIDLMYADIIEKVNSTTGSINLHFKHQLTKVVIKLSDTLTEEDLNTFSVKITNANTKASFLLSNGTLSDKREPVGVQFYIDKDNKKAEAILLPEENISSYEFIIIVGGISYSYPLKNSATIESFDASTKCEYNITLESNEDRVLHGVTATITNWETITDDGTATETEPEREEGYDPVPPAEGDGTLENPYSIAQAIKLEKASEVWVKGYIVGWYEGSFNTFTDEISSSTRVVNLALANLPNDEDSDTYFPVDLLYGAEGVQDNLNLKDNPENLRKGIAIKCNVEEWLNGGRTRISGKKIQAYSFVDE